MEGMHGQREALAAAVRAATVPLTIPSTTVKGTGFFITPELVLTCAHVVTSAGGPVEVVHGSATATRDAGDYEVLTDYYLAGGPDGLDLALLRPVGGERAAHVHLAASVAPGDELWVFGHPEGKYRAGDVVSLRLDGASEHIEGPILLKGTQGRIKPGMSGAPVLNWRTGAVCGVVRYRDGSHDDTARFVPISTAFAVYPGLAEANTAMPAARAWLELLDDTQLAESGARYPGPRLRRYLEAASAADDSHPYAAMLDVPSPLSKVYLRQKAGRAPEDETAAEAGELVEADSLLHAFRGVQVLGGPGAGKSSLARHLTAVAARRWLQEGSGHVVPILVAAEALTLRRGLSEMLADGVVRSLDTDLDRVTLTALFGEPPFPGAEWLVMVDGVDEILNPQLRSIVLSKVSRHRNEGRYRFLLTSRPLSDFLMEKIAENGDYPTFTIEPFGRHELVDFAQNWFTQLKLPDPRSAAEGFVQRVDEARLDRLAGVPLIATMLCILYANSPGQRLPENRAELYAEFVDLLLAKRKITNVRDLLAEWTGRSGPEAEGAGEDLVQRTPELLRLLAHEGQRAGADPFETSVRTDSAVIVARRFPRPATLSSAEWDSVIREVLRSCGLLVERRGVFGFIHQTVQEYLAAAHLAGLHPDPRRRAARRLFVPQPWPWPDLEVKSFLAALWARQGRDLAPVLRRLLQRRHRDVNYRFLVELHRQGVELPAKVHAKLVETLAGWVAEHGRSHGEWREAAEALNQIDGQRAAAVLEVTARHGAGWQRRLDSSLMLLEHNAPIGIQALEDLTTDETLDGPDRLKAAKYLLAQHPRRGMAALAKLARDIRPDYLRVEAARVIAEHDRQRGDELLRAVTYDPGASDEARLGAGRALGPGAGSDVLAFLSSRHEVSGRVRLDAALTVESWSAGASASLLLALAQDHRVSVDIRRDAAQELTDHGDEHAVQAYKSIVDSKAVAKDVRVDAAERIAAIDSEAGLSLLLQLVADPTFGEARITAGIAAGRIAPHAAARALTEVVGAYRQDRYGYVSLADDQATWIRAAQEAARLDAEVGVTALQGVITNDRLPSTLRLNALTSLSEVAPVTGLETAHRLVEEFGTQAAIRFGAAEQIWLLDRESGRAVIRRTALTPAAPSDDRMRLGRRISRTDKELGIEIMRHVASDTLVSPRVRLDAAAAVENLDVAQGIQLRARLTTESPVEEYLEQIEGRDT
ncbi:trypsin-like peptidase domain-containing protein [Amycolatopsis sp. NPDC051061]|uniref:trypsin-like peptidase domain-containing protein n=1 Tax=Amycolatopsis sp. NPDC051061 TaxID=3155042 RepID=UPI0034146D9F